MESDKSSLSGIGFVFVAAILGLIAIFSSSQSTPAPRKKEKDFDELKQDLRECVENEDYLQAAAIRDELKRRFPHKLTIKTTNMNTEETGAKQAPVENTNSTEQQAKTETAAATASVGPEAPKPEESKDGDTSAAAASATPSDSKE